MDSAGQSVAQFLEKLQYLRSALYLELYNQFITQGAKTAKANNFGLSGTPFRIHTLNEITEYHGALVTHMYVIPQADKPAFTVAITILWDDEKWTIVNEIEIENEEQIELFFAFPVRTATTLDGCFREIDAAADDLRGYVDTVVASLL